jgi:hypothetical protein
MSMFVESLNFRQKPGLEINQLGAQLQIDGYFDDGSHARVWLKLPHACQILLSLCKKETIIDVGGLKITYPLHNIEFEEADKSVKVSMIEFETALEKELTPIFLKTPHFEAWLKEEAEKGPRKKAETMKT